MATKELKQIWNSAVAVAVVVATITAATIAVAVAVATITAATIAVAVAVAILEQRQRKFCAGYCRITICSFLI